MSNQGKKPDEIEFNIIVGKNIRYLRKLKKLSQSLLADAIGVSCQQVSKYELGTNGLHSYTLYKAAHRVFNVNMDVLADPQMITKHKGFSEVIDTAKSPQDSGYLKPQKGIGSMEEITKAQMDSALDQAETESNQAESYIQYNENLDAKKKSIN